MSPSKRGAVVQRMPTTEVEQPHGDWEARLKQEEEADAQRRAAELPGGRPKHISAAERSVLAQREEKKRRDANLEKEKAEAERKESAVAAFDRRRAKEEAKARAAEREEEEARQAKLMKASEAEKHRQESEFKRAADEKARRIAAEEEAWQRAHDEAPTYSFQHAHEEEEANVVTHEPLSPEPLEEEASDNTPHASSPPEQEMSALQKIGLRLNQIGSGEISVPQEYSQTASGPLIPPLEETSASDQMCETVLTSPATVTLSPVREKLRNMRSRSPIKNAGRSPQKAPLKLNSKLSEMLSPSNVLSPSPPPLEIPWNASRREQRLLEAANREAREKRNERKEQVRDALRKQQEAQQRDLEQQQKIRDLEAKAEEERLSAEKEKVELVELLLKQKEEARIQQEEAALAFKMEELQASSKAEESAKQEAEDVENKQQEENGGVDAVDPLMAMPLSDLLEYVEKKTIEEKMHPHSKGERNEERTAASPSMDLASEEEKFEADRLKRLEERNERLKARKEAEKAAMEKRKTEKTEELPDSTHSVLEKVTEEIESMEAVQEKRQEGTPEEREEEREEEESTQMEGAEGITPEAASEVEKEQVMQVMQGAAETEAREMKETKEMNTPTMTMKEIHQTLEGNKKMKAAMSHKKLGAPGVMITKKASGDDQAQEYQASETIPPERLPIQMSEVIPCNVSKETADHVEESQLVKGDRFDSYAMWLKGGEAVRESNTAVEGIPCTPFDEMKRRRRGSLDSSIQAMSPVVMKKQEILEDMEHRDRERRNSTPNMLKYTSRRKQGTLQTGIKKNPCPENNVLRKKELLEDAMRRFSPCPKRNSTEDSLEKNSAAEAMPEDHHHVRERSLQQRRIRLQVLNTAVCATQELLLSTPKQERASIMARVGALEEALMGSKHWETPGRNGERGEMEWLVQVLQEAEKAEREVDASEKEVLRKDLELAFDEVSSLQTSLHEVFKRLQASSSLDKVCVKRAADLYIECERLRGEAHARENEAKKEESVRTEVKHLFEKTRSLSEHARELEDSVSQRDEMLSEVREEKRELSKQIDALLHSLDEKSMTEESIQDQLTMAEEKLSLASQNGRSEVKAAQVRFEAAQDENRRLQGELEAHRLSEKSEALRVRELEEEWKRKRHELEEECTVLQEDWRDSKEKVCQLQAQVDSLFESVAEAERATSEAKERLRQVESLPLRGGKYKDLEEGLHRAAEAQSSAAVREKAYLEELTLLKIELRSRDKQVGELLDALRKAALEENRQEQTMIGVQQGALEASHATVQELRDEVKRTEEKLRTALESLGAKEAQISSLQGTIVATENSSEAEIAKLRAERDGAIEEAHFSHHGFDAQLLVAQEEATDLKEKVYNLEKELSIGQESMQSKDKHVTLLKKQLDGSEKEIKEGAKILMKVQEELSLKIEQCAKAEARENEARESCQRAEDRTVEIAAAEAAEDAMEAKVCEKEEQVRELLKALEREELKSNILKKELDSTKASAVSKSDLEVKEATIKALTFEKENAHSRLKVSQLKLEQAAVSLSEKENEAAAALEEATMRHKEAEMAEIEAKIAISKEEEMRGDVKREMELRKFAEEAINALRREVKEVAADTRAEVEAEGAIKMKQIQVKLDEMEREKRDLVMALSTNGTRSQTLSAKDRNDSSMKQRNGTMTSEREIGIPTEAEFEFLLEHQSSASSSAMKALSPSRSMNATENKPATGATKTGGAKQRMLSKLKQKGAINLGESENVPLSAINIEALVVTQHVQSSVASGSPVKRLTAGEALMKASTCKLNMMSPNSQIAAINGDQV